MSLVAKIPREIIERGPFFRVYLGDNLLSPSIHESIQKIEYSIVESGADVCEIDFDLDGIEGFLDTPGFYEEMPISVQFGYTPADSVTFTGFVVKVESEFSQDSSTKATLFCMDDSYLLNKTKKIRTFSEAKISDVVKFIGDQWGLDTSNVQETEEVHEILTQREETDMQFLLSLVDRQNKILKEEDKESGKSYKEHNFVVKVKDGKIYFYDRNLEEEKEVKRDLYFNSGDSSIRSFNPEFITNSHVQIMEDEGDGLGVDVDEKTGEIIRDKEDTDRFGWRIGKNKSDPLVWERIPDR